MRKILFLIGIILFTSCSDCDCVKGHNEVRSQYDPALKIPTVKTIWVCDEWKCPEDSVKTNQFGK